MQKRQLYILAIATFFLTWKTGEYAVAATQSHTSTIKVEELQKPTPKTGRQIVRNKKSLGTPKLHKAPSDVASLSFSWNMPVSAAVFQREKSLWVVFDRQQNINIEELRRSAKKLATNIFQFPHSSATIIRMTLNDNVGVSLRKEGLLWIIDLAADDTPPPVKDLPVFTNYDSRKQPYFFIPAENNGNIVSAIDPEIGDIIQIAPLADVGKGTLRPYHYPEFDMLETHQGLAFIIKAEDITLSRGNTGVQLRAENRGINLSSDLEIKKRQRLYEHQENNKEIFDITVSPQLLQIPYFQALEQIRQDILSAPQNKKNLARLELVKFYLSYGMGTNALYILHQMQEAELPEAQTDNFHAMLGVANFLTRRYDEALQNFEYGNLPFTDEAIFWKTLTSSAINYQPENNAVLQSFISLIQDYPAEIKDEIAVIAAQNALAAGDDIGAQNFIDILKAETGQIRNRTDQITYLSAKKAELQGYPRAAIRDFKELANAKSEKYSSLARFDNVVLNRQLKAISLQDAIAELEKLKFAWSEKSFKWQLLNQLANYYIQNNDYYNGIRTLENTMSIASDEQKQQLTDTMVKWFEDIYLNNQADNKMSAIKSLALYTDFEWLADLSPHQHLIIQKLADRLVAVDLLPRAKNLLTDLLQKQNLNNEDRAKTGARLALISLFEEKPDEAITTLNDTEMSNTSSETQSFRRVIKARALADIGSINEALKLLKDDFTKNAILLKTEIFWKDGRWSEASDAIKYLIERPTPGQKLSKEQISYILDWATTLKKAGKETVLVRLRNKFQPYFVNTNYYSAFNVLTEHLEADKVDIRKVNNIVNDVQAFSNFAKAYNESLKNTDLK